MRRRPLLLLAQPGDELLQCGNGVQAPVEGLVHGLGGQLGVVLRGPVRAAPTVRVPQGEPLAVQALEDRVHGRSKGW